MGKPEPQQDDRRRVARMIYRPDHFLAVMAFAALAVLLMCAIFIACIFG